MASPFAGTRQAIDTPFPASPPRYGLLFCAQEAKLPDSWPNGLAWAPEKTLGGGVVGLNCAGNTDTMVAATTNPVAATADPFVVWAEDHCSTVGWQARDFEGRAIRQLEATQSYRIANELWLGTQAQAQTLGNDWLVKDPKILTTAAVAPMEALAFIEIGLAQMLNGQRGMIHVTPRVLVELHAAFAIELNGQLWLSPMGNIVVADAGYPGTKPTGAGGTNSWMYGTPLIDYKLGEIDVPRFSSGGDIVQRMNRGINDIIVYASREAILLWDWTIPVPFGAAGKTGVLAAETTTAAFAPA